MCSMYTVCKFKFANYFGRERYQITFNALNFKNPSNCRFLMNFCIVGEIAKIPSMCLRNISKFPNRCQI